VTELNKEDFVLKTKFLNIIKSYPLDEKIDYFKKIFELEIFLKKNIKVSIENYDFSKEIDLSSSTMTEVCKKSYFTARIKVLFKLEREGQRKNFFFSKSFFFYSTEHKISILLLISFLAGSWLAYRYFFSSSRR
jgi:hypothetical protein